MVITNKKELEMAAEFLIKYANEKGNYKEFAAFGNVANVLKQAIKNGDFDNKHDAYTLEVVKQPNLLDVAIEESCTTDCPLYRKGECPYKIEEKEECPTIIRELEDFSVIECYWPSFEEFQNLTSDEKKHVLMYDSLKE